jgi:hypothetical protein
MIMMRLTCLALSALLGSLPVSTGAAERPKDQERPAVKAKEVFHVYGGTCKRSWRLLGTFESVHEACWAARDFREKKLTVEVTTGTEGKWSLALSPRQYKVYVNPCKVWSLHTTTVDLKTAQGIADARTRAGDNVEIVQHFVSK